MERLEERLVLKTGVSSLAGAPILRPPIIIFNPDGSTTPVPTAFTPTQIRHAYCIDDIRFSGVVGDGRGQTIAIVDAFDNPKFVNSTNPGFVNSDLHKFDLQYGIPDPPSFQKFDQNGGTAYPGTDPTGGFEAEIALDVEWAHAIAPRASIDLVEATDSSPANLFTAIATAARLPNVVTVSMSFGGAEFGGEVGMDPTFTTPAGHPNITFLASTGDSGAPGGYPAYSPRVVAVGGTTLTTSGAGNYVSESGWSGSGGGISQFETKPTYQNGVVTQSATKRTIPDVAFDADPATGVSVYDSFNGATSGGPWFQIGGTSLACPCWAALITIADQGRAQYGRASLDGFSQTLPDLYSIARTPTQYATFFHDVRTGNNGFAAGPGYDLVTGIGSPVACQLIPFLAGPPPSSPPGGGVIHVFYPLRYLYDPITKTYFGNITISNTTANALNGPINLLFTGLPSGVTLLNATGKKGGVPFITVKNSVPGRGGSIRISIELSDPFRIPLSTFLRGFGVELA